MTFEPVDKLIAFVLPTSFRWADLTFSRLSSARESLRVSVRPDTKSRYVVSTAELDQGVWQVRLNWSDGSRQYHDEKEIQIV